VKSLAKDGLVSGSGVRAGWDVNLQMLGISWHPELFRKGFSWIFYDFLLLFSV
jgi:gamma-glutamyl-gamma-aminobutyrate hydrolase PuuD